MQGSPLGHTACHGRRQTPAASALQDPGHPRGPGGGGLGPLVPGQRNRVDDLDAPHRARHAHRHRGDVCPAQRWRTFGVAQRCTICLGGSTEGDVRTLMYPVPVIPDIMYVRASTCLANCQLLAVLAVWLFWFGKLVAPPQQGIHAVQSKAEYILCAPQTLAICKA
eukprot:gene11047-biopygen9384